jgi:predicted MFS family arabinose efflux permease
MGYTATYLVFALLALIPGILIFGNVFKLPEFTEKEKPVNHGISDLLKPNELKKVYITSAMILIGVGIYEVYFPIYGSHIGFSASMIGIILSVNASAYFIVRVFMSALIKRFGEEFVFTGSLMIAAIAFGLMPFFDGFKALAAVSFALGLGLDAASLYPS